MTKFILVASLLTSLSFADYSYSYTYSSNLDVGKPLYSDAVIFEALSRVDLDSEQIKSINKIRGEFFESKNEYENISSAFGNDSFNQEKYIEILQNKKTDILKLRAKYIHNVYDVLNKEQKEKFKRVLDALYILN